MIERPSNLGKEVAKIAGGIGDKVRNDGSFIKSFFCVDVSFTTTTRTLNSTYKAYFFTATIAHGLSLSELSGLTRDKMLLLLNRILSTRVGTTDGQEINALEFWGGGGLYYHDGTNHFVYKEEFSMDGDNIYIDYKIRRIAGTIAVPAIAYKFRPMVIAASNDIPPGGVGGGGVPAGPLGYYDIFTFDEKGEQTDSFAGAFQFPDNESFYSWLA